MKAHRKYWITLLIGAVLVLWIAWAKDIFAQTHLLRVLHILCDAFFAAGAVITAAGLMMFVTNEGAFDMLAYGMKRLIDPIRTTGVKKYKSYYDYSVEREKRKFPFLYLLICGGIFLAVALAIYFFYSRCL